MLFHTIKAIILGLFLSCLSELVMGQPSNAAAQKTSPVKKDNDPLASTQPDSVVQVDMIDYLYKLFKIKNPTEKRTNKKVQFAIFPSQSNSTGGRTVIASFNAAFLLGDLSNTHVSNVFFIPYISFSNQYGFTVKPDIWLNRNTWNFNGEYFLLSYPQHTWGLGGNSAGNEKTLVDYNYLRLSQNALKGLPGHLAIGAGYSLDYHYNIFVEENADSIVIPEFLPGQHENSVSTGPSAIFVYDSRRNSLNPQNAFYLNATWRFNLPALGSDSLWSSFWLDSRKYFSFSNHNQKVLALRGYYWTVLSNQPPYLDLPSNGWEPSSGIAARGIRQNRYRSNALLYFESEYRFGITRNGLLGGVVFANILSPSEFGTQKFIYWHPAAGTGLRIKFNKYANTNVAIDVGFSKDYAALYLNIGEMF